MKTEQPHIDSLEMTDADRMMAPIGRITAAEWALAIKDRENDQADVTQPNAWKPKNPEALAKANEAWAEHVKAVKAAHNR